MVGDMPELREAWYQSEGVSNILSIYLIHKDYQMTYDSRIGKTFRVRNKEKPSTEHSEILK